MVVYSINEEDHGQIGIAASRKAALQWLITSHWVDRYNDIWCPDENKYSNDYYMTLNELCGENWKEKFLQFSDEQLENMGFYINEEELIEEKD